MVKSNQKDMLGSDFCLEMTKKTVNLMGKFSRKKK